MSIPLPKAHPLSPSERGDKAEILRLRQMLAEAHEHNAALAGQLQDERNQAARVLGEKVIALRQARAEAEQLRAVLSAQETQLREAATFVARRPTTRELVERQVRIQ